MTTINKHQSLLLGHVLVSVPGKLHILIGKMPNGLHTHCLQPINAVLMSQTQLGEQVLLGAMIQFELDAINHV